jgi:hypothetical protein
MLNEPKFRTFGVNDPCDTGHIDTDALFAARTYNQQTISSHRFDMRRPLVDQGDIEPSLYEVSGRGATNPVGRANSPGYGHLKLPHLKIGRAADLRRVKQDVYFRSLQPRRGWGVERLEATAAKHSIYVT